MNSPSPIPQGRGLFSFFWITQTHQLVHFRAKREDLIVYAQVTPRWHMLKLTEESPKDRATRRMAMNISLRGGQLTSSQLHDPSVPYCDAPRPIERFIKAGGPDRPLHVTAFRPCRRCEKCLQFRQMKWRERAVHEIMDDATRRTWWMTLTLSPHHLAGILQEARDRPGADWDQRVDGAAYRHVTRYLKRLRKTAKTRFRYLWVFERGDETGRPHYHGLIHEIGSPITKSTLEAQWRSNVHCRLVAKDRRGQGAASYVTKYATKSLSVRIRASSAYGKDKQRPDAPPR